MSDDPTYDIWDDLGQPYLIVKTLDDLGPPPIREGQLIFVDDVCTLMVRKNGEWVSRDTYLECPDAKCVHRVWVSPFDQDSSLGELYNHVLRHADYDRDKTHKLLAKAKTVTEEKVVKTYE